MHGFLHSAGVCLRLRPVKAGHQAALAAGSIVLMNHTLNGCLIQFGTCLADCLDRVVAAGDDRLVGLLQKRLNPRFNHHVAQTLARVRANPLLSRFSISQRNPPKKSYIVIMT